MSKILIVEDEQPVAAILEDYLDGLGFTTETAADGQDAIDRVQHCKPDLVIMDLMLPRLTGGEAARLLKRDPQTADIPILAISGMSGSNELADLLAVDALLPKPFDLDDLAERLTELLPEPSAKGDSITPG